MKTLIFTIVALLSSTAVAAGEVSITCNDRQTYSKIVSINSNNFLETVQLSHNFAGATLQCATATSRAIEEKNTFRCAGIWVFDHRRPDDSIGTVAVAEFTHVNKDQWSAKFTTSHDYDNVELNINCTITSN